MYALVGCSECQALWIVEGSPETSQCPRCGSRRSRAKRRTFLETEDEERAREVRASMLAERQGHGDGFADLDSFADMGERVDDAGVSDAEYLAGSGLDPDAVAVAGERAGRGDAGGRSRKETVLAAVRELDEPDADDVVAYAAERGVPEAYVRRSLEKLVRAGELSESRGVYRPV